MSASELQTGPVLMHTEPVLAVGDVNATVKYWHEVLGFPAKWTWGEPANHGGVSWQGVFVQFSLNSELAARSGGNCIWIRVKEVEQLYKMHQEGEAEIVEELKNKPWGMAQYTVKDNNGYYIIFAGAVVTESIKSDETNSIRISERKPTAAEYMYLVAAVGWGRYSNEILVDKILSAPLFAVVAEDESTGEVIGSAMVIGDQVSFYYVKDVMVHPDWQRKNIGTKMMRKLTEWVDKNAPENAFVALITPENLSPFYKQFDFTPVFGMHRSVQPRK